MRAALAAKILLTALITFLLLEVVLLVGNDLVFRSSFYQFDPEIGFRVRAYAPHGRHRANEFGFNDRDYSHERTARSYRILVLSDSFNWTFGPTGNYVGLLERDLVGRFGDGVEVINAGYSSTHTGEQLRVLEKFGLQYQPDLVALGFFAGNDFLDADPERKRIVVGGATADVYPAREFYGTFLGQPVVLQSRLLLFLRESWRLLSSSSVSPDRQAKKGGRPGDEPVYSDRYLRRVLQKLDFTRHDRRERYAPNERYVRESLVAMRDLLESRGIELIVIAYPDEFQVDPRLRRSLVDRLGADPEAYEWERAQRLLEAYCREERIEFHDLLPAFREAQPSDAPLYLSNDPHWHVAGNQLAASVLADLLAPRVEAALQ